MLLSRPLLRQRLRRADLRNRLVYLVQLVVGASSISVARLAVRFMGGMALGSWLLPRLRRRRRIRCASSPRSRRASRSSAS